MPYYTPAEFQDLYNITRRDLAGMVLDEGLPVEHSEQHGLLIDEEVAATWLEEQGYLDDSDESDNDDDGDDE